MAVLSMLPNRVRIRPRPVFYTYSVLNLRLVSAVQKGPFLSPQHASLMGSVGPASQSPLVDTNRLDAVKSCNAVSVSEGLDRAYALRQER